MTDFIEQRKAAWGELAALVQQASSKKGLQQMDRVQLRRLGNLYRRAAADLAFARLRGAQPEVIVYLNELVTRTHGLLYTDATPGRQRLGRFLLRGFPQLIRRRFAYIAAAAALFWIGAGVAAVLTTTNPTAAKVLLKGFGDRDEDKDFYKDLPQRMKDGERPGEAAFLMTHNTQVAIIAFAIGVLGALPSLVFLCYQGMPLGAIAVVQHKAGYDLIFWSFIAPHGVTELTAIFIAGAAGMLLGKSLIAPGEHTRLVALGLAGHDAIRLLLGSVALFIIAGFTESFVSPTALPPVAKLTFAAIMAIALVAYGTLGRSPNPETNG